MKTLVVGDLHGQLNIAIAAIDTGLPVIFVGDYLDSFTASIGDQVETLRFVLNAVKAGQAQALYGNHELSYLDPFMKCSGWSYKTESHVMHLDLSPLKYYTYAEGFLISHAGVSQKLLTALDISLEQYLKDEQFHDIGRSRGGRSPYGGLLWCDWNQDFEPVEHQPQIVGHTRGNIIRQNGNSYCIDVLENISPQVAAIEDGEFEIFRL